MLTILQTRDERAVADIFRGGWSVSGSEQRVVSDILAAVRAQGDSAVVEYTRRFDWKDATEAAILRAIPNVAAAREGIPADIADAIDSAVGRVEKFHRLQRPSNVSSTDPDGTQYEFRFEPLDAVAVYVPGGSAPLPSTVIMGCIPARVAGVRRIDILTPPQADGSIHPAILYAAARCGADGIYAAGGAQAIAAAAYGTSQLRRVDGIVGPGNVWVTEAKRQVYGTCAIDGLAGPSEVLVVADASARVDFIVGELLAQAEHDPRARVAVVSESADLLAKCIADLQTRDISGLPRGSIISDVLARGCFFLHAQDRADVIDVIARFAPEHLSLMVADPQAYLPYIRHAGAIFVGNNTPVACGDYLAGTNHTLPTSGSARFSSGLSVLIFLRSTTVVQNSAERMREDAPKIEAFARFEGLHEHANAARLRLP